MTPTASPTTEAHGLETSSRALVDLLVEEGETTVLLDIMAIETEDADDADDLVKGWGHSISLPKPANSKRLGSYHRGKKGAKQSFPPDIDTNNIRVRCISDDYNGDHHRSSWKANVEPGTYRYISNNGIYRSTKFANIGSDWVTVKRSRHPDANPITNTPEIRQAKKTLMKDIGQMLRTSEVAKAESGSRENAASRTDSNPPPKVMSAAALSEPADRPTTQDTWKDPKLVKSASDLFVEKFSTRIDALQKSEKELQVSSAPRTPITPPRPGTSQNSTNAGKRSDGTGIQQADDIAKDVFTVKPVTRISAEQPLRPLEKLTPHQRSMDRGSVSDCSTQNSRSESPVLPTSFMNAMNAFAKLHHQHTKSTKDGKNRSGPSTYRSQHKNSLGGASASSGLSDTDSLSSVRNALTMTNSSIERMRMRPYARDTATKDYAVKDYGRFLKNRYRVGSHNAANSAKPPHGNVQRKGLVGYRPINAQTSQASGPIALTTTAAPNRLAPPTQPTRHAALADDAHSHVSDSAESYLSGTSMAVHRGSGSLTESKPGTMALPEISGKRLPVTITAQRLL